MSKQIQDALRKLDPANDNHWTEDGMPRMETVKLLAGDQSLTREVVTQALPGFTRFSAAEAANAAGAQAPIAAASTPIPTSTPIVQPVAQQPGAGPTDIVQQEQDGSEGGELSLEMRLAREKEELAHMEEQLAYGMKIIEAQRKKVDALIEEHDALNATAGAKNLTQALQGYFQQQQKLRAERANRMQAVQASGVDFKTLLNFKAPIDNAMARRTGRGGQRPVHPLTK